MKDKKIRFNGMDAFIIIAVIAVLAAAYIFLGRGSGGVSGGTASKNVEVTAVVELTSRTKEFCELIQVGDVVLVGEKEKMRTNVKSVEVLPAKTTGYDILEGRVPRSELPGEYDVQITLVGEGAETDKSIQMNGAEIRVGQKAVTAGKGWSGQGYVIGLETADIN